MIDIGIQLILYILFLDRLFFDLERIVKVVKEVDRSSETEVNFINLIKKQIVFNKYYS